jgi:hypothetical protein
MASPSNCTRWQEYILLISVCTGRDFYSYASYYCSQDRVLDYLPQVLGGLCTSIVNVEILSEDSWQVIENSYRDNHRVIEEN